MITDEVTVSNHLSFLYQEDRCFDNLYIPLVTVAVIVHECAFHCEEPNRPCTSESLLTLLRKVFEEDSYSEVFVNEARTLIPEGDDRPNDRDLYLLEYSTRALRDELYGHRITWDSLASWITIAWNTGVMQRRVYNCEIEGGVNNSRGTHQNFISHIALFGSQEGLLPSALAQRIE